MLDDGEDAAEFADVYGVRPAGNWEGRTILSRLHPAASSARTTIRATLPAPNVSMIGLPRRRTLRIMTPAHSREHR